MTIRFSNIVSRNDWIKIGILLIVGTVCWIWVYREYQKPIVSPEWADTIEVRAPR